MNFMGFRILIGKSASSIRLKDRILTNTNRHTPDLRFAKFGTRINLHADRTDPSQHRDCNQVAPLTG